jgi:glutamine cyclotransferase
VGRRIEVALVGRRVPARCGYRIVGVHPHDPDAFTQGLALQDDVLYESTGLYGRSSVREVDLESGRILRRHDLDRSLFGEGLAVVGDDVVQLTWRSGKAFRYDRRSFEIVAEHGYPGEGWGLAFDGERLVMSDGGSRLSLRDPASFEEVGGLEVRAGSRRLAGLNDLEFSGGVILANVFRTDTVARIHATSGEVIDLLDLSAIARRADARTRAARTNGIAFSERRGTLLVTGKLWPRLFELELAS